MAGGTFGFSGSRFWHLEGIDNTATTRIGLSSNNVCITHMISTAAVTDEVILTVYAGGTPLWYMEVFDKDAVSQRRLMEFNTATGLGKFANNFIMEGNLDVTGVCTLNGFFAHAGLRFGAYDTTPIVKQTSVAVSEAGIHAALVNLGFIAGP